MLKFRSEAVILCEQPVNFSTVETKQSKHLPKNTLRNVLLWRTRPLMEAHRLRR